MRVLPRIERHQVRRAAGESSIGGIYAVLAVFCWGLTAGAAPVELAVLAGALLLGGCAVTDQVFRALGLGLVLGMVTPDLQGLLFVQLGGGLAVANLLAGNAERFSTGHATYAVGFAAGFAMMTGVLRIAGVIPIGGWMLPMFLSTLMAPMLVWMMPHLRRAIRAMMPARRIPRAHANT